MQKKNEFVEKFTDILVQQGSVKKNEAQSLKDDFYNNSKAAFDYFLIDSGIVSKENILKALATYFQVPSIDVRGIFFDHDLLLNFPKDLLLRKIAIPYQMEGEILTFIVSNPHDPELLENFENYTDLDIEFQVGIAQAIIDSIEEYYDEPPEGYIDDLTDEDEPDDSKDISNVDELIDELIEKQK